MKNFMTWILPIKYYWGLKEEQTNEIGSNRVAETCRSNLNNNKLINEKLICAFRWSVLPSIMKMHGPKNKKMITYLLLKDGAPGYLLTSL